MSSFSGKQDVLSWWSDGKLDNLPRTIVRVNWSGYQLRGVAVAFVHICFWIIHLFYVIFWLWPDPFWLFLFNIIMFIGKSYVFLYDGGCVQICVITSNKWILIPTSSMFESSLWRHGAMYQLKFWTSSMLGSLLKSVTQFATFLLFSSPALALSSWLGRQQ